ncbi:metallophosphoesterase [Christensenellaceae bacterium OttesenSCG-928-K19]|nr:metallophosphoesterase [Christensenellaceae bacterium OttesenSCG-928-K19]
MNIYAIGDLHLSLAQPGKEMDLFGSHWENHFARISEDWQRRVGRDDVVLIPGDISWAMKLEDARPDLEAIGDLPGKKIIIRGNHDYWWGSAAKVESVLGHDTRIIQNNCIVEGEYVFCGSRGWTFPTDGPLGAEDNRIYERELIRLGLSLDCAKKHKDKRLIVMIHYPPLYEEFTNTEFTRMISAAGASEVVFGHLHGDVLNRIHLTDFQYAGGNYNLVSADYMDFRLKQIV